VQIKPRLRQLLLLLSSDQPGEVIAAAAAIKRTLRSGGCDFHDLVAGLTASPSLAPNSQASSDGDWRAMRDVCMKHQNRLSAREMEIVTDLGRWRGKLTPKQSDWLQAIYDRLQQQEKP
jgi:hypothetical protein